MKKKRTGLDLLWVTLMLAAFVAFTSGGGGTALAVFAATSSYSHGARIVLSVVGGVAGGVASALVFLFAAFTLDLLREIADRETGT